MKKPEERNIRNLKFRLHTMLRAVAEIFDEGHTKYAFGENLTVPDFCIGALYLDMTESFDDLEKKELEAVFSCYNSLSGYLKRLQEEFLPK